MNCKLNIKSLVTLFIFIFLSNFLGCAAGKYSLVNPPSDKTESFQAVEVGKIDVGATNDEVQPEIPIELRSLIVEEIHKKNIYQQVLEENDFNDSVIKVDAKIIQFNKGSQFTRWAVGILGAGKAVLDVECKFINKETNDVFAQGIFTAEVKNGIFGGTANQKNMSKDVAKAIARFLKKGK